jgi:hypothetical protein
MLFQNAAPADTTDYMIAGFIVSFVVMGLYVLSIYLRHRNLHQDLNLLEEMDKAAQAAAASKPAKPAAKPVTKKAQKK